MARGWGWGSCGWSCTTYNSTCCNVLRLQGRTHFRILEMALRVWSETHMHLSDESLDSTWRLSLYHHWRKILCPSYKWNLQTRASHFVSCPGHSIITDRHPNYGSLCSSVLFSKSHLSFLWSPPLGIPLLLSSSLTSFHSMPFWKTWWWRFSYIAMISAVGF